MPQPDPDETRPRRGGSPSREPNAPAREGSLAVADDPGQRVAAMRRGELTYEQLAAWGARHPDQVPTVHGEFEWILAKLPEVCE